MQKASDASPQGLIAAAISDGLVHLHKEYYGKGSTQAKTYLVNDTAICMLRGGFTVVERTLIDEGRAEAVHDVRRARVGSTIRVTAWRSSGWSRKRRSAAG